VDIIEAEGLVEIPGSGLVDLAVPRGSVDQDRAGAEERRLPEHHGRRRISD
jgi:hypothetical protein